MNKYIAIALIALASQPVIADNGNGWCNGRPSQLERDRCYDSIIPEFNKTRIAYFTKIVNLPDNSPEFVETLKREERAWELGVDQYCHGNRVCVYNSINERISKIRQFAYKNHIKLY